MEKRILRPRKEADEENNRPAKRNKRAFSTIECSVQMKAAQTVNFPSWSTQQLRSVRMEAVQTAKSSNISTQTDCCLAATNAQLTTELIAMHNLLQQKDGKYIEMLERCYLLKEKLTTENHERSLEIARLKQIQLMQNAPLIEIAIDSKLIKIRMLVIIFDAILLLFQTSPTPSF